MHGVDYVDHGVAEDFIFFGCEGYYQRYVLFLSKTGKFFVVAGVKCAEDYVHVVQFAACNQGFKAVAFLAGVVCAYFE